MTATVDGLSLKIGIIGPTRIGKTTIINCLLRSGEGLLAQTSVRMRWADTMTERKIQQQRKELEGWRVSRQFNPGALSGTDSAFYFRLLLDPGVPGAELHLDLLDYPGGWLDAARRAGRETEWEECRAFIAEASVLLIPVDAVVLMESLGDMNRHCVPSILTTPEVQDVARDWARRRYQRPDEPALVIICPVRTESYFADNGGRRDRSAALLDQVRDVYGEVLQAIRDEAPSARIRYCPLDTVGCVEFLSATWVPNEATGEQQFSARYRVRRRPDGKPPEIRMAGVDDVLVLIARPLFELGQRVLDREAQKKRTLATSLTEYASRNNGRWLNFWYRVTGQRAQWQVIAANSRSGANSAEELVSNLGRELQRLAKLELGSRVCDL